MIKGVYQLTKVKYSMRSLLNILDLFDLLFAKLEKLSIRIPW